MVKVSVIMPLYNAEKYIEKTIRSILNQTYEDFELIIVDDCSTDGSVQVVQSIVDKRIKLFHNEENKGIAYTRNRALEQCGGEYIAIMDDDDIAPNYRFEDEVLFLDEHPNIDVVTGNTCVIDEMDTVVGMFAPVIRNPKLVKANIILGNVFGNSTAMVRRDFIERYQIRYIDRMYGTEDYRFWAECSLHGNISALDKVMLYWRQHDNESKKQKNAKKRSDAIISIQKYLLDSYGFVFEEEEYQLLFRIFAENGKVESLQDIERLYCILQKMVLQAKENQLDNVKEITIMCRKTFGKKCGTAFFLWEEKLL